MCLCVEFTLHLYLSVLTRCQSSICPIPYLRKHQTHLHIMSFTMCLDTQFSHSNHVQVWRLLSKVTLKCKFYKCINKDQYTVCILFVFTCGCLNKNDQECLKMVISYCMYRGAGIFFNVALHEMFFCFSVSI